MDAVYTRFESYDFDADSKFQRGLVSLGTVQGDADKVLEMKLFFYNRFVEPIDSAGFKLWRSSQTSPMDCHDEQQANPNESVCSNPHSTTSEHSSEEPSTSSGVPQLSFAEVMRLVQAGEEVPGVVKLDIKPSNQNPTPSQCQRVLKPWEVASASN